MRLQELVEISFSSAWRATMMELFSTGLSKISWYKEGIQQELGKVERASMAQIFKMSFTRDSNFVEEGFLPWLIQVNLIQTDPNFSSRWANALG
jgi:hypothetical protein